MRPFKNSAPFACALVLALISVKVHAGTFDCSVVYDEFESLMNKQFLTNPDKYVQTLPGQISKEQFDGVSKANFHLYPSRKGLGIGILTTNLNTHAKFLFHFGEPMADGTVQLIIDELVKYGRVEDGYAPERIGPFRLKPGMSIDVDTGKYVPLPGELTKPEDQQNQTKNGDLLYDVGDNGSVLKAVNGAAVEFPLETLCKQDSG
jgi:hypothetical protein